ncbi:leukocyte immunoglobulin-like receptor subfamily B member 3 [Eschrichtius robustus]|uniref:leukocyte immunoglobulin-like receptor subfamily B member 3 n=1 Tax=Eschrichtius robustus TaxID=9764 RepID=UPI0035BEFF22
MGAGPGRQREQSVGTGGRTSPLAAHTCGGSVSLARSSQSAAGTLHLLKKEGGVYREPSLSAQQGSLVLRGDSLTLRCRSKAGSGRLALTKDEEVTPSLCLEAQHSPDFPLGHDTAPPFQNNFTLSPVTSAHSGTYTCYSSLSTSPSLMSQPSDPLELLISGGSEDQLLPHTESGVQTGLKWYLECSDRGLGGLRPAAASSSSSSDTGVREDAGSRRPQHQCSRTEAGRRGKTSPKAAHPAQPARSSRTAPHAPLSSPSSSPAVDFQEESLSSPFWKHLPCGLLQPHTSSPLTFKVLNAQVELAGLKAAASEAPQDVTYAQLNHSTLRRETAPPTHQSGEPPVEPSVYAALAVR